MAAMTELILADAPTVSRGTRSSRPLAHRPGSLSSSLFPSPWRCPRLSRAGVARVGVPALREAPRALATSSLVRPLRGPGSARQEGRLRGCGPVRCRREGVGRYGGIAQAAAGLQAGADLTQTRR